MPTISVRRGHAKPTRSWRPFFLIFFLCVLALILLASGVMAWKWMQKPTSFQIKKIEVQGRMTHVLPGTIEKIMQTQLTGGFFSLQVSSAQKAILAFPWIADVSFRRVWPETLIVKVREHQPIARFGARGVASTDGHVFFPDIQTIPASLPELDGPIDQVPTMLDFYKTANTLVKLLNLSVTTLQINAENSWNFVLSNQIQVNLGRHDVLPRLKRFVAVYPKIAAQSTLPIAAIDLRYANGVAVQYKSVHKYL